MKEKKATRRALNSAKILFPIQHLYTSVLESSSAGRYTLAAPLVLFCIRCGCENSWETCAATRGPPLARKTDLSCAQRVVFCPNLRSSVCLSSGVYVLLAILPHHNDALVWRRIDAATTTTHTRERDEAREMLPRRARI